jgi:hypothetical protein
MADNENIFNRLEKLFRSNIIIKRTSDGQVKVKDVDMSQTALTSNFVDRYNKVMNSSNWAQSYAARQNRSAYDIARKELFRDYELMDTDSIISATLDIYSDESTVDNVENEMLKIKTDNPKIHAVLDNLFNGILNIKFNLWSWIRNMTKYGDFYLQLDILDKTGVVNVRPISAYEINRLEGHDPSNPKLVQFELEQPGAGNNKSAELLEEYEVAHFRMLSDSNYLPYGKSMLEGARKVWKQLTLMEDAMLIHRIMRAPEKRIFKIDIGNIPPSEVENYMQKIIGKMKKIPVIDQKTGEYNLRYNVESVTEDYYLPVRGGDSGTEIDTLPGLSNDTAIDDIEYLRNRMMAALKVPKAFLGYEEGIGSKATLAAEDVRFARTIERLQKIIVAELEKIAMVHLKVQGFSDAELINFDLELTNPSMIHQQEKLELLTQQVDIATSLIENKILSREWIYDNIFEFNNHEKSKMFDGIIEDQKQKFRFEQIETEGNDPAESGKKVDNDDDDLEMARKGDWGGSEKDDERFEFGKEKPSSSDIKDATKYERERYGKRSFKHGSPLHPGKGATIIASESLLDGLKAKFGNTSKNDSMLNENILLEYKEND